MSTSGQKPGEATFVGYKVKANAALLQGVGVKFSADHEVDVCGANDKAIGIPMTSVTGNASGTSRVEVMLLDGGTIRAKVSSGGATRGEYAICGSGGFENQTIGGGTTVKYIVGQFLESGVSGDFVELRLGGFAAGCA